MMHWNGSRPRNGRGRPGQTLVIALSVMFLLFFIGALFVALVARNLGRVAYTGERTSATSLAQSGLDWVNTQLTYSEPGADWRPSPTWPTFVSQNINQTRQRDPDYPWLSDNGTYQKPWTRIASGDGRFLIRVDYEPRSTQSPGQTTSQIFDPISGYLHVQTVGRPGRFDPQDPTDLMTTNNPNWKPGTIVGQYQQLEAWKPIGLTDQLWWITNKNKERGPAVVGLQAFQNGQGRSVLYDQIFEGGFRSNVDVLFQGPATFNLFPLSGEAFLVNGSVRMGEIPWGGTASMPPVTVNILDETQPVATQQVGPPLLEGPTGTPAFKVGPGVGVPPAFSGLGVFRDNLWLSDNSVSPLRSIQYLEPPTLDLTESGSTDNRYRKMTQGTGVRLQYSEAASGPTRVINSGDYGYGEGIYVDNFTDIQYSDNRDGVVNEWLRRGPADVSQTGWAGSFYTPSVRESGTVHGITEVELLPQGIKLTRYDRDIQGRNLEADNQYKSRIFYQAVSKTNPNRPPTGPTDLDTSKGLKPVGPSILMPYPASGVLYAEGSLRIRGQIGRLPDPALNEPAGGGNVPVNLTVVSGGSIYIEGSLIKTHPASELALLAHDYVVLNPTQFTAVRPYEDVTIEPDGQGANTFHYAVPQEKDLDLIFTSSAPIAASGMLLNLQHSAGFSDNSSNTSVSMYVNGLDPGNRYDFRAGAVKPPYPPGGGQATGGNPYLFQFFPPPTDPNWWLSSWGVTNFQSSPSSTVNYERKSFWIPKAMLKTGAGQENVFRFHVDATPNGQPWWLAGASLVPYQEPLKIEVDAVIYAQNGSWFVIPQPWFNDNPLDSRDVFRKGDNSGRAAGSRGYGTFPANTDDYPFYREPNNVQVTVKGAVTESVTAESADRAQWIKRMTMELIDPVTKASIRGPLSLPKWYQPNIRYVYDQDLRNWVRYRNVGTGDTGVAYTGTLQTAPSAGKTLAQVRAAAMQDRQHPANIVTLPLLPRLPTSGSLFRGRPL